MMRADTQAITIKASPRELFEFLANPEHVTTWAPNFAKEIRRTAEGWVVRTAQGEMPIRYATDAAAGVLDYYLSPVPGVEAVTPSRVVANGDGSEYILTAFYPPDMPDDAVEAQRAALAADLRVLQKLFER
jgi:hypothetical protein